MKKFILSVVAFLMLSTGVSNAQGWVWPTPADVNDPVNITKLNDVISWLGRHGNTVGNQLVTVQLGNVAIPGAGPAPYWPFVVFCSYFHGPQPTANFSGDMFQAWNNLAQDPKCAVSDFGLVIKNSAPVLLVELENKFQFGNPTILVPYPDPGPPPPPPPPPPPVIVPVGNEIIVGSGVYYCLDPTVTTWTDARGTFTLVTRVTPFGNQYWYKKN